jgi:hypothetical protein
MAEREGFEPPVRLPVLRISSAARSTTLPPLRKPRSPLLNAALPPCKGHCDVFATPLEAPNRPMFVVKHPTLYRAA